MSNSTILNNFKIIQDLENKCSSLKPKALRNIKALGVRALHLIPDILKNYSRIVQNCGILHRKP